MGRGIVVALVGMLVALVLPSVAAANVTSSQVTTPSASPTYLTYNSDAPNTSASPR